MDNAQPRRSLAPYGAVNTAPPLNRRGPAPLLEAADFHGVLQTGTSQMGPRDDQERSPMTPCHGAVGTTTIPRVRPWPLFLGTVHRQPPRMMSAGDFSLGARSLIVTT